MYTYRTLCAVLTARGSDIMKITVLKTPDLYVRTEERMDTLIVCHVLSCLSVNMQLW